MTRIGTSFAKLLVAAGAVVMTGVWASPPPAAAAVAPPSVEDVPGMARYTTSSTIAVYAAYSCTNTGGPRGTRWYVVATLTQPGATTYRAGSSTHRSTAIAALCTGSPTTQRITLHRPARVPAGVPDPVTLGGPGEPHDPVSVTVRLEGHPPPGQRFANRRSAPVTATSDTWAACNGSYADGRCSPPTIIAPSVGRVPATLSYSGPDTMTARVTYTCQDLPAPRGAQFFLQVRYHRSNDLNSFVTGYRNDHPGVLKATCTGAPVTHAVTLVRSSYILPGMTDPGPGDGDLSVTLESRGTQEMGGWYAITGPPVTRSRTSTLLCDPAALPDGSSFPSVCP